MDMVKVMITLLRPRNSKVTLMVIRLRLLRKLATLMATKRNYNKKVTLMATKRNYNKRVTHTDIMKINSNNLMVMATEEGMKRKRIMDTDILTGKKKVIVIVMK